MQVFVFAAGSPIGLPASFGCYVEQVSLITGSRITSVQSTMFSVEMVPDVLPRIFVWGAACWSGQVLLVGEAIRSVEF